jgi:hypothetical protein
VACVVALRFLAVLLSVFTSGATATFCFAALSRSISRWKCCTICSWDMPVQVIFNFF